VVRRRRPQARGQGFAKSCVRETAERRDGGGGGDLMEERDAELRRRAAVSEKAGNGRRRQWRACERVREGNETRRINQSL
jgi:hypothetical protein